MKKVVLGFSSGVDSTASAIYLIKQGYEVIGVYLDVLSDLPWKIESDEFDTAKNTAEKIGISLYKVDASKEFFSKVVLPFCDEYLNGRTPNPCIICNPNVKFYELLKFADENKCDYIATGHYAGLEIRNDKYYIKEGRTKDQSYMLYLLPQDILKRLILPLGSVSSKDEVREVVRNAGLENFEKKDSQEICFLDNKFTKKELFEGRERPGEFVNSDGKVLGTHKGISQYTIGQRKKLGISSNEPLYITKIDASSNRIILGKNEDLYKKEIIVENIFFTEYMEKVQVKTRSMAKKVPATLKMDESEKMLTVIFDTPERAPTPGQSAVFYDDDLVIGGGIIQS